MSEFPDDGGVEDMPPPESAAPVFEFRVGDIVSTEDRGNQGEVIAVEPGRVQVLLVDKYTGNVAELYFAPAALKLVKRAVEPRTLKLLTYAELRALPPSEWLVEDVLRRGELAALFGAPASFKTFVAIDIALRVVTGQPWADRACSSGSVLYIAAEGLYSLRERTRAWVQQFDDIDAHEAELDRNLLVLGDAVSFIEAEFELLIEAIKDRHFAFIVVDTLARCMAGGDENVAKDMGLMVRACDRLRRLTGATVLLVHHSGKSDPRSERGSSALRGACDAMLVTIIDEDDPLRVRVACEKQKEGAPFDDLAFRLNVVQVGGGRESGRLEFQGLAPREKRKGEETDRRDPDEVIQRTLAECFYEDGAPDTELKAASKLAKTTYHRHLHDLVDDGVVDRIKVGRGARYLLTPKSTFYRAPPSPSPSPTSPTQSHGTEQDPDRQSQSQSPTPPLGGDGNGTETDNGPAASTTKRKPKARKKQGGV